jgi:hypothetical protein
MGSRVRELINWKAGNRAKERTYLF